MQKLVVADAFLVDGVYKLNMSKKCLFVAQAVATGEIWHKILGHINSTYLNKMKNGLINGINYNNNGKIEKQNCTVCCEGK